MLNDSANNKHYSLRVAIVYGDTYILATARFIIPSHFHGNCKTVMHYDTDFIKTCKMWKV